jgi:hypothetical protein
VRAGHGWGRGDWLVVGERRGKGGRLSARLGETSCPPSSMRGDNLPTRVGERISARRSGRCGCFFADQWPWHCRCETENGCCVLPASRPLIASLPSPSREVPLPPPKGLDTEGLLRHVSCRCSRLQAHQQHALHRASGERRLFPSPGRQGVSRERKTSGLRPR